MTVDEFLENFGHLADAPGGVDRLRELILQLAVRGKLVEQDPQDEPASVLLEKIEQEKRRLYEAGEIRKPKKVKAVSAHNLPFETAAEWAWCRVGQLALDIQYGYTASAIDEPTDARFVRISDIQDNSVDWLSVPYCEVEPDEILKYALSNGDLLIARTGGTVGKSYLVHDLREVAVFASYLIRILPTDQVVPQYLWYFTWSPLYWSQLHDESKGTGQPNVNATSLRNLFIPLPPLAEQHRIVARVDELMELCDELEAHKTARAEIHGQLHASALDRLTSADDADNFATSWGRVRDNFELIFDTPDSVDALRQAILELAVRGKLVEQDPDDEPAEVLSEKIAKEKKRLYEAGEIRKPKKVKAVKREQCPFELPARWAWCRVGHLIRDITAGKSPKAESRPAGPHEFGVLKVSALSWGEFLAAENKTLPNDYDVPDDYLVRGGDLLISRANTTELVGAVVYVWSDHPNLMLSDKTLRLQYSQGNVVPRFLMYALRSSVVRNYFEDVATGTSQSMRNLSQAKIRRACIPLPPLAEQRRIVAKVDELMEQCDALEDLVRRRRTKAKRFAEAVVHAAASEDFGEVDEVVRRVEGAKGQVELALT